MSSYAGAYLRGAEVFSWRNEIDPTFLFLFTSDDVCRVPKDPEDMVDDDDVESVLIVASAAALADQLDVLDIGPKAVDELFGDAVARELDSLRPPSIRTPYERQDR